MRQYFPEQPKAAKPSLLKTRPQDSGQLLREIQAMPRAALLPGCA